MLTLPHQKLYMKKLDDIAYTFVLTLPHQKLYMRNHKWKTHIMKRVQCIICHNITLQKSLWGKMDDMT